MSRPDREWVDFPLTTAVYFDLDGTVLTYDESFEAIFERAVGPDGGPTPATHEAYVSRLLEALEDCEADPYRLGYEAAAAVGDFDAPPATLAARYREAELEATVVDEETKRTIERIAAERPTGFLTNGDGRQQRAKLERHGLDAFVDEVIVSNDVGVRKPDERIFEIARERLPADEYAFVGDAYDEDVVGGHEAGFRTIYVAADPAETAAADAVVESVGALLEPRPMAVLE